MGLHAVHIIPCGSLLIILSNVIRYGSDWGRIHGGNGGQLYEFELNGDDILSVEAHHSQFVNSIKLILSNGQVIGPYGTSIGLRKSVCYQPAENRGLLAYISGSSGEFLDKIAFHFEGKYQSRYICCHKDFLSSTGPAYFSFIFVHFKQTIILT